MTIRTQFVIPAAAALLLLSGAATTGMAQPSPASAVTMNQHQALALASADSLAAFARTLQQQASGAKIADLGLARATVVRMRHSFDLMQQHHQAQVALMGEDMKSMMGDDMTQQKPAATKPMKPTVTAMQLMEVQLTALRDHLGELEATMGATTPSQAKVSTHTADILEHCAAVSRLPKPAPAKASK